jgi:hypothetical protein
MQAEEEKQEMNTKFCNCIFNLTKIGHLEKTLDLWIALPWLENGVFFSFQEHILVLLAVITMLYFCPPSLRNRTCSEFKNKVMAFTLIWLNMNRKNKNSLLMYIHNPWNMPQ